MYRYAFDIIQINCSNEMAASNGYILIHVCHSPPRFKYMKVPGMLECCWAMNRIMVGLVFQGGCFTKTKIDLKLDLTMAGRSCHC